MKQVIIQVNPYLEFMNSILLTSKYNEITIPHIGYGLMTDEVNCYTESIKEFFQKYQNNRIYNMIEEMIPNGFTFSRPVELMLCLGNSKNFKIEFMPSQTCIDYCGGLEKINVFVETLKGFAKETKYFDFYNTINTYYEPFLKRVRENIQQLPLITLIENQYGKEQNSYNYVLSSLMKGNFGIDFINNKTKKSDIFSVFSIDDFSLSNAVLFHEFSHPFINPLTKKFYSIAEQYSDSYIKLQQYKLPDYQSGYGDWEECINEHFVRAMTIHLLKKCNFHDMADNNLKNDLYRGYKYIPLILERYKYYDDNRGKYTTFEQFYPDLLDVFKEKFDNV